uniref:Solute carrier family 38 member 8b n=1 Tax=Sinocyclocheilus grahami TaxID=75366 RepID=A0A672MTQ0_SINGR
SRHKTYHDVVREVCGQRIGHLCEICFVFNLFMISVAFLVVVQDQLDKRKLCVLYPFEHKCLCVSMPYHWYTYHRFALFVMCLIIILPLSVPKEIGIQKYTRCVKILNKRLTLCCNMAGVFGFLTFGREVASDILMSYPGVHVVMIIARLLSVILTQILRFWERRAIITSVFESRCRLILTILWITVTLLIAIYIPDMSEVISVIGGISAFFIFIFPALLTGWGVVTVVTGAFIFGQSTSIAVMELMHKF